MIRKTLIILIIWTIEMLTIAPLIQSLLTY